MAIARHVVRYLVVAVIAVIIGVLGLVVILTRTDFGVERAGRYVLERLDQSINGTLTVDRITSGGLLDGVTLHGVALRDVDGRPFLRADSARLDYRIRTLLTGSVVFDRLTLFGPDVTIERFPGEDGWNYERIFADTTAAADTVSAGEPGQTLILIRDATVHDGRATIRFPLEGEAGADTTRMILERVPGGRVRTLRFDSVQGRVPEVVWQSPESPGQEFRIRALATRAYIWDRPLEVADLEGVLTIRDSIIAFDAPRARLPGSDISLEGEIIVGERDIRYDVDATASRAAFRDFQWLYPPLPDEGGGSLRLAVRSQAPGTVLWLARDVELRSQGSEVSGTFGLVTGESLGFTDVSLRAEPLDLELLASLLPGRPPLSGLVIGTGTADGPMERLRTAGDVRFRTFDEAGEGAESMVRWEGVMGAVTPYPLREMEVELRSVDLAQVAQFAPDLRLRGTAQGTLRASGSVENGLRVASDLTLSNGDLQSVIRGSGELALSDRPTFDLQVDADPVRLELLADQVPSLSGLRGDARGPITASGTLDDLTVGADITTPAGDLVIRGNLALNGRTRYQAEGSVTEFRLDRVVADLPETSVTGRFDFDLAGATPEDMEGRIAVDVLSASIDGVDVYRGTLRGRVSDAVAQVDSFRVVTEVGDAWAQGSFGLMEGRTGELAMNLRADSLLYLEPILFEDLADGFDIGLDEASRVDGQVVAEGLLSGSVAAWRASGTARVRSLLYDELEVGRGRADVVWRPDSLRIEAELDSLRYRSRRLAGTQGTMTYTGGRGLVALDIRGRQTQRFEVETEFEPEGEVVNLGLRRLHLSTRDGDWSLADTAHATVGGNGFRVDSMVLLRSPGRARIRIAGVLPWREPEADEVQEASLAVDLEDVRIGEFLRVAQSDTLFRGVLSGTLRVGGTAVSPELRGRVDARSFQYGSAVLDSVLAEVAYVDQRLDGTLSAWQNGTAIVQGEARVPIDLALREEETRLLDLPLDVSFTAEGVPAELLTFLTPGFTDLAGFVEGDMRVSGTASSPDLQGALRLYGGAAYFEPLAVRYRRIQATARMTEGSEIDLDAVLSTADGRGRIQGTLDLAEASDPAFDLQVEADRLNAAGRRDVTAMVNGTAHVGGRYTRPTVSGDVTIVRGELNLDELWRQYQIVQLDTTLFRMLDTTQVSYRPSPESPFLENLRIVDTTIRTNRGFWLRSQELNVEVGGSLALAVDRQTDDFRLTGSLQVAQGNYQLLARGLPSGRRFSIREGTIEFVGTPGINPNLDIEAAYRVRPAQGEPINVIASVTGTLQDPRVSLSSDADIPMSETDLASYILFGRASAELTQAQLDVAAGGSLALGVLSPVVTGAASTGIQQVATSLGLPVDYVAFSLPEYGGQWQQVSSPAGLLQNAVIEVGFDPAPNVSVIGSVRIPSSEAEERASTLRLFGARIEYRPWQTWTVEGYIEDQFARRPSFGATEFDDRRVLGLSFFREWGY